MSTWNDQPHLLSKLWLWVDWRGLLNVCGDIHKPVSIINFVSTIIKKFILEVSIEA